MSPGTPSGIPVRLSEALTARARASSRASERSLTQQVEHWARLGQAVEAAIAAPTTEHLKALSHDQDLEARLAVAKTPEGQRRAAALIHARNPVAHGVDASGRVVKSSSGRTAAPGRRSRRTAP